MFNVVFITVLLFFFSPLFHLASVLKNLVGQKKRLDCVSTTYAPCEKVLDFFCNRGQSRLSHDTPKGHERAYFVSIVFA